MSACTAMLLALFQIPVQAAPKPPPHMANNLGVGFLLPPPPAPPDSNDAACANCSSAAAAYDPTRMSRAVVNAAVSDLKNVIARAKNKSLRSADLAVAISSNQILLAHLDEIGFYENLDSQISSQRARIIDFVATEDDVAAVRAGIAKNGVFLSQDEVRASLQKGAKERVQALDHISANGSRSVQVSLVQMLSDAHARLQASAGAGKVRLASARATTPEFTLCEAISAIAAAYGLACAISLGTCIPCCLAAAVAGLEAALCNVIYD